jgi:hypothetical protein
LGELDFQSIKALAKIGFRVNRMKIVSSKLDASVALAASGSRKAG